MRFKVIYLLVIILLAACDSEMPKSYIVQGFDNPVKINGEDIEYDDFFTLPLIQDSTCVLTNIIKIEKIDSLFIIYDQNGIYSFDTNGHFICKYGTKGHGRGEYINISAMWIDRNNRQVCILDDFSSQIIKYNLHGKMVDVKHVKNIHLLRFPIDVEKINANELFLSRGLYKDENEAYSIINIQNETEINVMNYSMTTERSLERLGNHQFSLYDKNILFIMPFMKCVYTIKCDKGIVKYVIKSKKEEKTENEISQISNFSFFSLAEMIDSKYFKGFTDIFETKDFLFLPFSNYDYFLINKEHLIGQRYTYQIEEMINNLPIYNIKAVIDNYLVGVMYSYDAPNLKEVNMKSPFINKFIKLTNSFDENSGPVLLFYKIKHVK